VRALLCLVVLLGLLGKPTLASACKCEVTQRELEERYTVFVGTAVEYLELSSEAGA
jgi:hypothetical protein